MAEIETIYVCASNCRGCGSCQLACSFAKTKTFNPSKSAIRLDHDVRTGRTAPVVYPFMCDLCGGDPECVKACTYEALLVSAPEGLKPRIVVAV